MSGDVFRERWMRRSDLVLVRMRSYVCLLALLQCLACFGAPLYDSELASVADRALTAALEQVNSRHVGVSLYRATRGSVTRVLPTGSNTVDLLMTFSVKETDCAKDSGKDPQTCSVRPGLFVPTFSCSSRVRMAAASAQVLSIRCSREDSSSSESSEEVFSRRRQQFNIPSASRVPAPPPPPPPPSSVQPGLSLHSWVEEAPPRGDTFSNFVV